MGMPYWETANSALVRFLALIKEREGDYYKLQRKKYYTAKEAQEILNMTYSALRNQVIAGHIRSEVPPGKRQAVYLAVDIDALKHDMEIWRAGKPRMKLPPTKFVKATIEDMPEAVELADEVFSGVNTIPVEKRITWLRKNPDIDYLLKQEGRIVGYFSLIPLRPETIEDLLTLNQFAKDLTAEDILPYTPNVPVDLYGMAIGTKPGVSHYQKHEWGKVLIVGARGVILDLAKRGMNIRSMHAHSNTPDGVKLMRHLGFTEIVPKAPVPGLHDFIIEVERSGIPFIMRYKEEFKKWQEENIDSKVDSRTGRKPSTMVDASGQNGTKGTPPN